MEKNITLPQGKEIFNQQEDLTAKEDSLSSLQRNDERREHVNAERFVFSFYVKINRKLTEQENLNFVKSQLVGLEEVEDLTSLYFKRYFNRLLFNEIVIDFLSSKTELWKADPKCILRKVSCYNDAYKFSQLNLDTLYK